MKSERVTIWLVGLLLFLQLSLMLVSWILSATMTEGVHSLLSVEGMRWFFGHFVDMLASPWLVWLLLLSMAYGCLVQSGLLHPASPKPNRRTALLTSMFVLLAYVGVVLLLTAVPHAILLSAIGRLVDSPFSRAFVPVIAMGVILVSASYGVVSRRFPSFGSLCHSLSWGISKSSSLLMVFVFFIQFYESVKYVFL